MTVIQFADYFWGEKNEGFQILYQNMKCGLNASKDLADLCREMSKLQEDTSKAYLKMVKQLSGSTANNSNQCGSFTPLLVAFKTKTEKLASVHNNWMIKLADLVKDVTRYTDELQKTHKKVKEDESVTLDAVKIIQETTILLQKSKETYKQRCLEVERLKRDNNVSQKDLEKAEAKFRKAQEDYKTLVDKYCSVRDDFERKMTLSSKRFQEVEMNHLKQMREFVECYCQIVDNNNNQWERIQQDFQVQLSGLTIENLIEQFTLAKYTGLDKPGPIEFEEEKVSATFTAGPPSDISDKSGNSDKVSLGSAGATSANNSTLNAAASTPLASASSGIIRKESSGTETPSLSKKETKVTADTFSSPTPSNLDQPESKKNIPTFAVNPDTPDHETISRPKPDSELLQREMSPNSSARNSPQPPQPSAFPTWTGFLRRRQKKDKKNKKDDDESQKSEGEANNDPMRKSQTPTPVPIVDDEGYSQRPGQVSTSSDPWADFNQPTKQYDSSSDESDDDSKRKIKVEIKPLENGSGPPISASVDELRTAVGGIGLIPLPQIRDPSNISLSDLESSSLRRSHSQSHVNQKPSQDLLGLTLHPIEPIDPSAEDSKGSPEKSVVGKNAPNVTSTPVMISSTSVTTIPEDFNVSGSNLETSTSSKEVRDIFGDLSDLQSQQQPSLPLKQNQRPSSAQREEVSRALIALPRPPSRHGTAILSGSATTGRVRASASLHPSSTEPKLSIAKSGSASPPARSNSTTTKPTFGISRGPSPLTLGSSDVVPLAVAFQEVCHVCFRGADESQCQVRMIGDMMVSFPAGIVQVVMGNVNSAPLMFRIKNSSNLESLVPNKNLIVSVPTLSTNECSVFEFHMGALRGLLKKQAEQNPGASYFNIDILKYQIKTKTGAGSCPLQMVAYWKCTDTHTDLRLDYKYNAHSMSAANPLLNLTITVPIDGGVKNMQSKPNGTWMPENNRALWKFPELSQDSNNGVGSLRGRFELSNGPGSQGTIAAQFNCEGTTLSSVEFELVGAGYRLSLVKKRFVSGKYVCDGDASSENRYRYAAPPATSTNVSETV